jgi:hypothetical protein
MADTLKFGLELEQLICSTHTRRMTVLLRRGHPDLLLLLPAPSESAQSVVSSIHGHWPSHFSVLSSFVISVLHSLIARL